MLTKLRPRSAYDVSARRARMLIVAGVAVGLSATTAIAPVSAGAAPPTVAIDLSAVDCGWDPVTRTLWPAVRVVRLTGAPDYRVSARVTLDVGATTRTLGMGRVLPNGALNQNGWVDGPPATTKVQPLLIGTPAWIRPWGGRFGDGVNGGAALTPGVNHTLHVTLFDFNASANVTRDISCRTAGPFVMESSPTESTTAFAAGKVRRSLAEVANVAGASGKQMAASAPTGATGPITKSFRWEDAGTGDMNDWTSVWWRPQGLAGSFESGPGGDGAWSGVPAGKQVLIVSWYKRNSSDATVATRLSIINTSVSPPRYVHVNLVEPCPAGSACNSTGFRALTKSHLGGLAWTGRYLYAAETKDGFRVFDLTQFYQLPGPGPLYVLPQVKTFSQVDTCPPPVAGKPSTAPCPLRFSFASIANGAPDRLVSGEYDQTSDSARIVSWPLDVNGLIATKAAVRNDQKDELITGSDLVRLQGVAASGQKTVLSASYSSNPGKRHRVATVSPWTNGAPPGMGALTVGMPVGIEDLASTQAGNQLWSISEFETKRWVWATTFTSAFGP